MPVYALPTKLPDQSLLPPPLIRTSLALLYSVRVHLDFVIATRQAFEVTNLYK